MFPNKNIVKAWFDKNVEKVFALMQFVFVDSESDKLNGSITIHFQDGVPKKVEKKIVKKI